VNHNFLIPLLLLFICTSCDDSRHIRHYSVKKEFTPWNVPSNWIFSKGSSMRIGSFDVPYLDGKGDLSVIKLGGSAGGLAPNINRWRGQLNLAPHTEEKIQKYIQTAESLFASFKWLTIINPENPEMAFIASIFQTESHTIFVKLSATTDGISELKPQFLDFCKSFTLDAPQ